MKAKKHLGQHFLCDDQVISRIVNLINDTCPTTQPMLEVGPGQGVLTFELEKVYPQFKAIEYDEDMVNILCQTISPVKVVNEDFIQADLVNMFQGKSYSLVGNFPYNISSQIIFRMLENKAHIPVMVGMFQKEVAERICATPGGRKHGIISLRAQAFYTAEKIFDIGPDAFDPPPKVNSSVIVLRRKNNQDLGCDPKLYAQVIKLAFSQRRKKLRNTLKAFTDNTIGESYQMRPEQLGVQEFVTITNQIAAERTASEGEEQ